MSLLSIENLTLRLDSGLDLLQGISLQVAAGETVGLVGESGSGKSLTARAVLGLRPARSTVGGAVLLAGTDMATADAAVARRQRRSEVSMVFQDPRSGVNPVRRIGDFLTESLRLCHGWSTARANERALELLAAVGLPDPQRHLLQYPHELSGGMLQRVIIASALSTEPNLLVCDEPTTALDVTTQAEIIRILVEQTRQRGMGMLFITHDLHLAAAICDRVSVMRHGSIVEAGSAAEVFRNPATDYTRELLAATPSLDRPIKVHDRPIKVHARVGAQDAAPPALVVQNLGKTYRTRFGDTVAVDDVSFVVEQGAAFGIVGESGSGKSTIARILAGLERADAGRVLLGGSDLGMRVSGKRARLAAARARQIVFQDPYQSLDPRVPIGRAVERVIRLHRPDERHSRDRALEVLQQVGIEAPLAESLPRQLSGGQRQRAAIAKALAVDPALLILDEATSALDVSVQAQVLDLLRTIRGQRGLSIVFVSHDLAVVRELCDETLVLQRGRTVEQGDTATLLTDPRAAYTRLLLDSVPRAGWDLDRVAVAADRSTPLKELS